MNLKERNGKMLFTFIGLCVICFTVYVCTFTGAKAWIEVTKIEKTLNGATIITGEHGESVANPEDKTKQKEPEPNFGDIIAEINREFGGIDNGEESR